MLPMYLSLAHLLQLGLCPMPSLTVTFRRPHGPFYTDWIVSLQHQGPTRRATFTETSSGIGLRSKGRAHRCCLPMQEPPEEEEPPIRVRERAPPPPSGFPSGAFRPGTVVWAKVEGHDWWPARVVRRRAVPREVGPPPGGQEQVRIHIPCVFFTAQGIPGELRAGDGPGPPLAAQPNSTGTPHCTFSALKSFKPPAAPSLSRMWEIRGEAVRQ